MYRPITILSKNAKTGCSINFPIAGHCQPTKNCAHCCYARCGRTVLPVSKRKQIWVSNYLKGSDISQLIHECKSKTAVRLSGTGDINPEHCPNILKLARNCPTTMFWGMTRKPEIAKELNGRLPNLKLMVSVDSSSPESVWNYQGVLCYGPRLKTDKIPDDPRIRVIFPYHRAGRVLKDIPVHEKDCQAVRHKVPGCMSCGRCWTW